MKRVLTTETQRHREDRTERRFRRAGIRARRKKAGLGLSCLSL
jgi:hypothetical protein